MRELIHVEVHTFEISKRNEESSLSEITVDKALLV
jgi:hypothetical protein